MRKVEPLKGLALLWICFALGIIYVLARYDVIPSWIRYIPLYCMGSFTGALLYQAFHTKETK